MEFQVFVLHLFNIEADGGNGGDHLAHLQPVQNGGLASAVQTQDEDAHLSRAQQATEVAEQPPYNTHQHFS